MANKEMIEGLAERPPRRTQSSVSRDLPLRGLRLGALTGVAGLVITSFACSAISAREGAMSGSNVNASLSSGCAARLRSFIAEIDRKIETSSSVEPLQQTIKNYFPLSECNVDEAVSIARRSKYFDRADQFEKDVVIVLRKKAPGAWGFVLSFALSRETGESKLPTAMVDKTKKGVRSK